MVILSALSAFVIALLLHGLVLRVPMRMDSISRFLLIGVPLGLALCVFTLNRFGFKLQGFAPIMLYALLCELYIFSFTLVLSSVSATMLIMLRNGSIPVSALASVYDPAKMVQIRLDRLIHNGFIEKKTAVFALTPRGMSYHRAFTALRVFFGHS